MSTTDEEKLRKEINYWSQEALIAEEQGDEEQARKYFERAEALGGGWRVRDDAWQVSNDAVA